MGEETAKEIAYNLYDGLVIPDTSSHKPQILRYSDSALSDLIESSRPIFHDELKSQLKNLFKIRNPKQKLTEDQLEEMYRSWESEHDPRAYGIYVYYPWNNRLIHLLDKQEFIELRTTRNKYKITDDEQDALSSKVVGIIGLSVGQSVAVTIAMERACGKLRLADFDELELSNLNRIRGGVKNLGLKKTIIAAREIAEIDPFIEVELFEEGVNAGNIDEFLAGGRKLDLLVEECDSLPVKILARKRARSMHIPVVMDTSDRGMLDIERFDMEPERPLFHGLIPELEQADLSQMDEEKRIGILLRLVGGLSISDRLKSSLIELNESINSWPQLGSSVTLGGAITTDVVRKILLGKKLKSGRYYVDMDQIIEEDKSLPDIPVRPASPSYEDMLGALENLEFKSEYELSAEVAEQAVEAAAKAPSSGNDQPWLFFLYNGAMAVFHNINQSYSFGDFRNLASYQSIGAAIENLSLYLQTLGIKTIPQYFPTEDNPLLVAVLTFEEFTSNEDVSSLVQAIPNRLTNRKVEPRQEIPKNLLDELAKVALDVDGTSVQWITDPDDLREQGEIIAGCDKIRVFNPWGHSDFFHREMRWTPEEAMDRRDGIDIRTLEVDPQNMLALRVLSDYDVVKTLETIDGGNALNNISVDAATSASAFGLITRPKFTPEEFLIGGRAWERLWLKATDLEISVHPLIAPLYLFPRLVHNGKSELSPSAIDKLNQLRKRFARLWNVPVDTDSAEVFLFRIFKTDHKPTSSLRLPTNKIFFKQ